MYQLDLSRLRGSRVSDSDFDDFVQKIELVKVVTTRRIRVRVRSELLYLQESPCVQVD